MKDYDLAVMRYEGQPVETQRQIRIRKSNDRMIRIIQIASLIGLIWYALSNV